MSNQSASAQPALRLVLEGVPRIHFYEGGPRCPEDIIFHPSCVLTWNT